MSGRCGWRGLLVLALVLMALSDVAPRCAAQEDEPSVDEARNTLIENDIIGAGVKDKRVIESMRGRYSEETIATYQKLKFGPVLD